MIPDFRSTFATIESYRYSITTGLFLLFLAPFFIPVTWGGASSTWQFAAGLMFFLSFGMILTRDVWPWIRSLAGWCLNQEERAEVASRIIEKAKQLNEEKSEDPPFRIEAESDDEKKFIKYSFEKKDCRVEGDEIVVSATGLDALKGHL